MTQVVVRADADTARALDHLVELTGRTKSDLVRDAIKAAEREAVLERMRAESLAIRDDPAERAELREIAADLESLRAW